MEEMKDTPTPTKLRERTLKDLFSVFEGIYGPSFECRYYPCHFSGQDCSFCYCPFYPCLIYDMGGEIKVSSDGNFVWSCVNCWKIHEKDFSENVMVALSRYPRQRIVEEDWFFFNEILQELLFGDVVGIRDENYYLLDILSDKVCEEIDDGEVLAVKVDNFSITSVRKIKDLKSAENEIIIPVKSKGRYYGVRDESFVVCYEDRLVY
jgi:hypothetical protein